MDIKTSDQKKNAAGTTHELSPTTRTQKFFKTGYKVLDNASFKSWRGHDMYVTQYFFFR